MIPGDMTDATATRATSAWRRRPAREPSRALRAAAEDSSWQQRYEQVLQANERLHAKLRTQEDAHRKSLTVVKYEPSLPNNDVFTKELVEENRQLIARYRALELKLARLENEQVASAPSSPRRSVDRSRPLTRKKGATRTGFPLKTASVQTDTSTKENDEKPVKQRQVREASTATEEDKQATLSKAPVVDVQFLVTELKQRLTELDVDLVRLREENELLRMEMVQAKENDSRAPSTRRMEDIHAQLRTKEQQQELEHLLNDRIRQMKILEEQFTHLKHKVKTKSQLYKESLDTIEQLNAELFDARQTMLKQAEWLHAQEDRNLQLTMLEKEVHVLRSENATLNDTVGMLSARPLDALNVLLEKKALQISLLDDEKMKLENELKKASQDYRIVMQTNDKLRGRVDTLTKQLETQLVELYEWKRVSEQSVADREIAELQLQFYLSGDSAESKQLMEAVGRALKAMQKEQSGSGDVLNTEKVAEKCIVCQRRREGPTGPLYRERIEKMADISNLIGDDTRAQLRDMRVAHQAEIHALRRQSKRWEQRANDYLKEIARLRQQITEEATRQRPKSTRNTTSDAGVLPHKSRAGSRPALPADLAAETLLSVRVFDLRLSSRSYVQDEQKALDFVVFCDYFDFEPQHSPVFSPVRDGGVTALDMEISYKLLVDEAFCSSPLATAFNIELHELNAGAAPVVGVAFGSLQSLFMASDGQAAMTLKLVDPITQAAIGSLRIALSLASPTSHLFETWRQVDVGSHLLAQLASGIASVGIMAETHQAILSIRVIGMVLTKDVAPTSSAIIKLWYRFMGHPTVRYSVKKALKQAFHGLSYIPVDRLQELNIPMDQQFLDFLARHEMPLHIKSENGRIEGNAVVSFGHLRRHESTAFVSTVITRGDPSTERSIGRVWLELRVDTLPTKHSTLLDTKVVRRTIERVFGCYGDGSESCGLVEWLRFCDAISLSPAERAVRHLLLEKTSTSRSSRPKLQLVDPNDSLPLMLERCGISMSRTELSFISGVLLSDCLVVDEDATASLSSYWHGVNRTLALMETTMESEWLQIETALQRHLVAANVIVTHAGHSEETIDWDTFAHRIRLL